MRCFNQLSSGPRRVVLGLALACSLAPAALAFDPGELRTSTLPVPPDYDPAARLILPGFTDGEQIMELPEALELFLPVEEFSLERSSVELFINGVEYSQELEFWLDRVTLGNIQQIMQDPGSYQIEARVRDAAGTYWDISNFIEVIPRPCLNGCPWPFADTGEPVSVPAPRCRVVSKVKTADWIGFCT